MLHVAEGLPAPRQVDVLAACYGLDRTARSGIGNALPTAGEHGCARQALKNQ